MELWDGGLSELLRRDIVVVKVKVKVKLDRV